ncbi:MAG: hypothetical protein DRJ64_06670 [Thermoprotei archaeon]|nr:MAG: hypothetical protein DRJ64_06670 [Thermoprotei archaeon]
MPKHIIYQGNVLDVLKTFPDEYVDCIITSPPYWGLRDYGEETNIVWGGNKDCDHEFELSQFKREPSKTGEISEKAKVGQGYRNYKSGFCKKCGAWYGQLGLEPTLDLYLEHLFEIMKELKRVLKKSGVIFWNHGDCYGGIKYGKTDKKVSDYVKDSQKNLKKIAPSYSKCMMLQNYRFILRCIDELGLILRNVIIWYKPNHMPESVKDRFTSAYEPVFMLTKSKKYWFDLDAVRVPHKEISIKRSQYGWYGNKICDGHALSRLKNGLEKLDTLHPLGKNPGDLWAIPTYPFPESHFAIFPENLVEPMIKAGCPQWICKKCGKPRKRIVIGKSEKAFNIRVRDVQKGKIKAPDRKASIEEVLQYSDKEYGGEGRIAIGWTDCGCNAGWKPGIVLDPFAGSGTTNIVAEKLGRNSIGIEINPNYIEIIRKRFEPFLKQTKLNGKTELCIKYAKSK